MAYLNGLGVAYCDYKKSAEIYSIKQQQFLTSYYF